MNQADKDKDLVAMLTKASVAVFLAADKEPAEDLSRLLVIAAEEIERLRHQIKDAEIGLMTWDDGKNSQYWIRHHPNGKEE